MTAFTNASFRIDFRTSLLKYYTTWCGHGTSLKWHTFDKVKATHATQVSFGDSPRQDTRVLQNKPKKCTGLYYKCDIATSRARSSRSGSALSPFGQHYSHFGGIVRGSRVSHGHWSQLPRFGHRRRWVVVADTDYITQMHTHTHCNDTHTHEWNDVFALLGESSVHFTKVEAGSANCGHYRSRSLSIFCPSRYMGVTLAGLKDE